jgi:hypothetical protein
MVNRPRIDHVTTVVPDFESSSNVLAKILQCKPAPEVKVPGLRVRTLQLGDDAELHVATPLAPGPAEDFLRKAGGGLHHLALRFDDLDLALAWLHGLGVRTLGPPFELVPGVREVFLDPATTGGLVIQAVERRNEGGERKR